MAFFILRKLILQTRMRSHPVGLDVWCLVGFFVYFHTSCVRTAKSLARLRECAGSPEPSLVAYVISTIISWAGSNYNGRAYAFDTVVDISQVEKSERLEYFYEEQCLLESCRRSIWKINYPMIFPLVCYHSWTQRSCRVHTTASIIKLKRKWKITCKIYKISEAVRDRVDT